MAVDQSGMQEFDNLLKLFVADLATIAFETVADEEEEDEDVTSFLAS